jgi:hypothetical protein
MSILFVLLMFLLIISVRYFIEPKTEIGSSNPKSWPRPQRHHSVKREYRV